jgi:copper chaperone CopZ
MENGTLKFIDSYCSSCTYAIERTGRKVKGITDVMVDARSGLIHIIYNGDAKVLDRFKELTFTLGHGTKIIESEKE